METSWSEFCEAPFAWDNVMDVAFGEYLLSGVCCLLVCETAHIVCLGWTRHIGKAPLSSQCLMVALYLYLFNIHFAQCWQGICLMITALQVVRLPNIKVVNLACYAVMIHGGSLFFVLIVICTSRLLLFFSAARLSMTSSGSSYHL